MLAALIIVFREVFEAGLIVGIIMAVTAGVPGRGYWVTGGIAAGVLGAGLVAVFTGGLSELFDGSGQELFNAGILGFAVLMLTWHNVWMSRHGRELARRDARRRRSGRRRLEVARRARRRRRGRGAARRLGGRAVSLWRRGVAGRREHRPWLAGGFVGLVLGALVCLLTYLGLVTIPQRYLFGVTSALIALLAAGMAAQAIAFLEQANIVTALDETVWDTSWLLSELEPARPRAAHADRLRRPADRDAVDRLCGDARGDGGADEGVRTAGGSAAASEGGVNYLALVPAKAGTHNSSVKILRGPRLWIPACAGMCGKIQAVFAASAK